MSERKVLNKYIPPNFDPEKIPKGKVPKDKQHIVRLMAPFSMRCKTCGEYIYKGRKFNARKETVQGEEYLGIKIFRFYIRCTMCAAEITFKTDPQNSDYSAEHGATRNTEPWREEQSARTLRDQMRLDEEARNPMKHLENKSVDSKKEIQLMETLDDIRAMNARAQKINSENVLEFIAEKHASVKIEAMKKRRLEEEQDDAFIEQLLASKRSSTDTSAAEAIPKLKDEPISQVSPPLTAQAAPRIEIDSLRKSDCSPVVNPVPSRNCAVSNGISAQSLGIIVKKKS